jgi:predicted nucleotidyltransferase
MDEAKLDKICHLVRKEVEKEGIKVKSIILFGSACRA